MQTNPYRNLPLYLFIIGILFAVGFWVFEATIHAYFFNSSDFFNELFPSSSNELWMRFFISALFFIFGCIAAWIAHRTTHLQYRLSIDRLALQAMHESVVVTDHNNKIIFVNPAYTNVTGYTPAEVLGKNPSVASSGKQDKKFYKALWQSLQDKGCWQGELWNRRKDGELYPEWLSITVIKDKDKKIINHVAVFTDITLRKETDDRIKHYAYYDPLTDLPNRRFFLERLSQGIQYANRNKDQLAVMFIDMDHFKQINDAHGHDIGDLYLCAFAKAVKAQLRAVDTLSRFGGDEFVILLTGINDSQDALSIAKKILSIKSVTAGNQTLSVGCSIGIACYPQHGDDPEALLANADKAMYQIKQASRNAAKLVS
ncbi:MAG: diguanylate cyclase [Coxiellaceae bacterium]|nr:diguanylate cyclase [Coxiellaceae bacterium]